jgi:hypothetical protein
MNVTRSVLGISLLIDIEVEDGITFAKCSCPVQDCNNTEDSADNGLGAEHAANITAQKIKTHLIMSHGYKDDSEENKDG